MSDHANDRATSAATDGAERAIEVENLERALAEEKQAVADEKQRTLRALADFDNLRRRVARDNEMARGEARRAALLPLLAVLDTLERALAAGSRDHSFYQGVAATHRLFLNALREAGADPIETVGRPFDPNVHEALGTAPADGVEPGTVAREVRRGWRLGDGLLRPAQVVVASEEPGDSWR